MKFKIRKSALSILLGSTMLFGCSNNNDITKVRHYYDEQGNEITEEDVNNYKDKKNEDKKVIREFERIARILETTRNNEPLDNFKEKCYEQTIKYGDFIIEGKPISGVTLDELTDDGKKMIINMSFEADSKIIEYFPEYKEYISTKVIAIKEKTKNFTVDVIGEENYEKFDVKKDEVVSDIKNIYTLSKEKIAKEYEEFKNNHKAK